MRIGYLECFSGISGDMLLGSLVDAGVPLLLLEETAAALNVGARLERREVVRGGLTGTKIDVLTPKQPAPNHDHSHEDHHHGHLHELTHDHGRDPHARETSQPHPPHRHLSSILKIIAAAPLADPVKARASRAFQLLGEAEAAIHSIPVEKIHFHEVGAVDTIVDIVCSAAACHSLNIDRWLASPLNVGSGTVHCQHGTLPVPAPATLALLADAPVYSAGEPMERITPTGAALLRMLEVRYVPLPAMRVQATGYGAGGRDTPGQPNLLRVLIGETVDHAEGQTACQPAQTSEPVSERIAVLETTIDDSSPQLLAYAAEILLAAGAWDVLRTPVQMKKGRTGTQLTVLCRPELLPALRDLLIRETTTIGLRWRIENKLALARELTPVQTPWGPVRIKIARWPSGEVANAAPEYEDCRALATRHAIPLKQVMQEAMRAYTTTQPAPAELRS
ncbi:MAG TPA: nickel pincer cofactor biosynthesis protein LarC [Terracidiphilus sp.]|nr:nickel pincer cofactor biosynthesis protein LarC [Terracidiphilus sp.]